MTLFTGWHRSWHFKSTDGTKIWKSYISTTLSFLCSRERIILRHMAYFPRFQLIVIIYIYYVCHVTQLDMFCLICGKFTLKLQRKSITPLVKMAYKLHSGSKIDNRKESAPGKCYSTKTVWKYWQHCRHMTMLSSRAASFVDMSKEC